MSIKLLRGASLTLAALAVSLAVAAPVSAAPGNNGTIKIDGLEFSDHPNNEPHVGCMFEVEFFGFDEGGVTADVIFEAHAPSGSEELLIDDDVPLGPDGNGSRMYTLDVTGLTEHPNQGYHIKLTIHAEGSKGADTKHKVFWVTGCDPCEESEDPPFDPPQDV